MAEQQQIVSHILITVNGHALADPLRGQLLEVQVDQHVHLPAMFTVRFYDPGIKLLDEGPFNLAAKIEISAKTADGKTVELIKGEITALEPEFGEGMIAELTVRGYDKSHRLYRERQSKTYLNVKDSDLAKQIAQHAELAPEVDNTPTVYEHLYQHNQSDLTFLRHRAWRIGYECFVAGGKLYFRKPSARQSTVTVTWGQDLLTFRPRITLAEQVKEVQVKGWDIQNKQAVVGRADSGTLYPKTLEIQKGQRDGKAWSQERKSPGRMIIVDQPVVSQAEADILAAARLNELSGAFIEAEGEAFRRPDIQAGYKVQIEGLGKRLTGTYLVTRATHVYTDAGLKTTFAVSGLRSGMLSEQMGQAPSDQVWTGAVPAIVTNTDDPNGWGRVKVKYPWLSDDEESNWARVLGIGAGKDCGFAVIPDVEDEVMVVFEHGDFDHPIVLGGMWNGKDAPPAPTSTAATGEKPLVRSWTSRTGHSVTTFDNADNKLEILTAGGHHVTLNDAEKQITIKSSSGLELVMDDNGSKITVKSGGEVEVNASGNLTLKGRAVSVEAAGDLTLQASGQVSVKGAMINLN